MVFKEVTTEREFYDTLAEHPNELVVLDFFAPWGPPCTGIEPYFEKLSNKKKGVVSMKINVDNTVFVSNIFMDLQNFCFFGRVCKIILFLPQNLI